jgi:SsrA-binding protein
MTKVKVALAEGKAHSDKREALKGREQKREMDRIRKGARE